LPESSKFLPAASRLEKIKIELICLDSFDELRQEEAIIPDVGETA